MPKASPELYLLFEAGLTPKMIIDMGYSRATAYKYFNRYQKIRKTMVERLQKYVGEAKSG